MPNISICVHRIQKPSAECQECKWEDRFETIGIVICFLSVISICVYMAFK